MALRFLCADLYIYHYGLGINNMYGINFELLRTVKLCKIIIGIAMREHISMEYVT